MKPGRGAAPHPAVPCPRRELTPRGFPAGELTATGAGCRGEERRGEERRVGETRSWGGPGVGLMEPPTEAE